MRPVTCPARTSASVNSYLTWSFGGLAQGSGSSVVVGRAHAVHVRQTLGEAWWEGGEPGFFLELGSCVALLSRLPGVGRSLRVPPTGPEFSALLTGPPDPAADSHGGRARSPRLVWTEVTPSPCKPSRSHGAPCRSPQPGPLPPGLGGPEDEASAPPALGAAEEAGRRIKAPRHQQDVWSCPLGTAPQRAAGRREPFPLLDASQLARQPCCPGNRGQGPRAVLPRGAGARLQCHPGLGRAARLLSLHDLPVGLSCASPERVVHRSPCRGRRRAVYSQLRLT